MQSIINWRDYDAGFVRKRYNRLARIFVLFEWMFWLPGGIRKVAVERLDLPHGGRVLEIGCGTGRNLSLLAEAVGREGHVYGVDISEGMLGEARELCERKGYGNVTLVQSDAAQYAVPEKVDGVLFSLSYATMSHHKEVLRHAWNQLRAGGWLVIMDAKLPNGIPGKITRLCLPFFVLTLRLTVLGNPFIVPADELRAVASDVEYEEFSFGTYFICRAKKKADS
ncbi:MAG: class I SAM-dependent methyltransferase [Pyrinomonadaceae bacterium]|nr:class I SAM-dependent methyltransferase [Pyrinomonadaceae bacterium]